MIIYKFFFNLRFSQTKIVIRASIFSFLQAKKRNSRNSIYDNINVQETKKNPPFYFTLLLIKLNETQTNTQYVIIINNDMRSNKQINNIRIKSGN